MLTAYIDQLMNITDGDTWLDETFGKKLKNIPEEVVFMRPVPGMHSVAEIISHLHEWRLSVISILRGGERTLTMDSPGNWKTNDELKSHGWKTLQHHFYASQDALIALLQSRNEDWLQQMDSLKKNNFEYYVQGLIHHDLYHLGQIGMILRIVPHNVQAVPDGYHSVTPFIIVKGAAGLLEFLKNAFGAGEISRVPGKNGTLSHAETRIGDSVIMMFDSKHDWQETPAFLRLYVEDCDATYKQALKAGAAVVTEPTNMPWGDRVCRVRDPFDNLWWIMTRIEDLSAGEIEKRFGEKEFINAMKYVESAEFLPGKLKDHI
jgi:uncharacterized glyoxalase superfamily protein PhnB/uncharacterized damage-inducible protein DinB